MKYTIYNPSTGEITGSFSGDVQSFANLDGKVNPISFIEGDYSPKSYYVDLDTLQPVSRTKDPSTPIAKYQFDWTTKQWVYDPVVSADLVRQNRDLRLSVIDKINPIWYSSLTAEQQQELQAYRQALLDVPQQTGFPQIVSWPTKPAWL